MICSCCITPIHLALNNTTHDAMTLIQREAWCSLTRSALQVRKTFNFLASVVVETTDTVHAGTHLSRLHMAMRTGDLWAMTHLRHHKTADLPLQFGAELAPWGHLLPGSRQVRGCSTIQLAEGGHIPHICHGHHGRCPCKKILSSVKFSRLNANNCIFYIFLGYLL